VWSDEASITRFAQGGAHAEAIPTFPQVATFGATARWSVDAAELPLTLDDGRPHLGF